MGFKYIMLSYDLGECQRVIPVIFPDFINHIDIEQSISELLSNSETYNMPVGILSAGEINIDNVDCFGESESLHVKSREDEDSQVILCYNYLHGIE